ncbi:hypothetical protein EDB81DRAFT_640875 [Dactylonectria macrodidyma]|uniref:2EXR domain-containing protein n=1 Tax=Dactylonectria macrodidyma TaxID=307937 RepID=A0A9P9FL57_9HYPO|nr:hypothetical protein EDB81DRAFT_640875 [Dactylonectria macrodidyma]
MDGSTEASDESDDDAGGLLDVMADEGEDTDESDEGDGESAYGEPASFTQFLQLPPELRQRVWEFFCPELRLPSRILDFVVSSGSAALDLDFATSPSANIFTVHEWLTLEDQTRPVRTMLAVHQESRTAALKQFPDCLTMRTGPVGEAIVRFNKEKDVAVIHNLIGAEPTDVFHLPDFAEHIKHVAIAEWERSEDMEPEALAHLIPNFSILESIFFCTTSGACRKKKLTWCTSELVNRHFIETFEKHGIGENLQLLYAWPDLANHIDFARFQIPQDVVDPVPDPVDAVLRRKDVRSWPMIVFEFERGLRRYERLLNPPPDGDESGSSDESESESEPESGTDLDQYESDGIDDEEIVEQDDFSDDEISLVGQDQEGVQIDQDGSEARFSSPEAQFSSPEPEATNRGRKRRVVEDSDDESEGAEEPTAKRARITQIISSDAEDGPEETEEPAPVKRKSRVVLSDSESDDEEQMEGSKIVNGPEEDENESASGSDETEESEESESEDDDQPAAPLSLAERLRMHREVNPIESSDNDDGSDGEDNQDDNSEDEEDSEDEGARNPFFVDEAEDEEEDEDEDDLDGGNEDNFYQLD